MNLWKWLIEFFTVRATCRGCGKPYDHIPAADEPWIRCKTPGCYWMIFTDGGQCQDLPGK